MKRSEHECDMIEADYTAIAESYHRDAAMESTVMVPLPPIAVLGLGYVGAHHAHTVAMARRGGLVVHPLIAIDSSLLLQRGHASSASGH
jgi:hypothetical protein